MKKSENTNAFFNLEGRCETLQAVPRSQPAIRFNCTAGTGSEILNTNHMFPNVNPFTSPRPLYVRAESELFQSMYVCKHVWFSRGLYTGVFCTRLCMAVGSREQYRKPFRCIAGQALQSKQRIPMKSKRGRPIASGAFLRKVYF